MHNPLFYERQRMRASTYNIPRFLHAYDETLDGGLILPRGMLNTVTDLAAQAGSRLDITDERTPGTAQEFTLTATLTPPQRAASSSRTARSALSSPWETHTPGHASASPVGAETMPPDDTHESCLRRGRTAGGEVAQIGTLLGMGGAQQRGLVQGAMGPVGVAGDLALPQDHHQPAGSDNPKCCARTTRTTSSR
jgi:hypothetical protein